MFQQPVRKIGLGSRSITGKHASTKTGTSHQFESSLERDFLTLLEFDPHVERYVVQPVTIHYSKNNKHFRYTPDVAVYYAPLLNRLPLLVEIKYAAELQRKKTELEQKFEAARKYAGENGLEFCVLTEKEVRTPYLENIKFLSRYMKQQVDVTLTQQIMSCFNHHDKFTVQQLTESDNDTMSSNLLYTTWQLLARRILLCDLQQRLSMISMLWKNQNQ